MNPRPTRLAFKLINLFSSPWSAWLLIGGLFCAYAVGFALMPLGPVFWSPDEGGKYLLVGQLAAGFGPGAALAYPGAGVDPTLDHVPLLYWLGDSGAIYSWWPVWFPLISAPFFGWLGMAGLYVLPLAGSLITAFLVYRALFSLGPAPGRGVASVAAGLVALTTPLFFYTFTFWEHTLQVALILAAFYLLVNDNSVARLPSRPFLAGICLGLAIYLRLESVIFVLAAGLAMILWGTTAPGTWVQRLGGLVKQRAAFGIGLLLAVTPLFLFNGLVEGHWLGRRYASDVAAALERAADPSSSWAMRLLPALAVGGTDHNGVTLQPLLAWLFVLAWGLMLAAPWLLRRGWAVPVFVAGFTLVGLSGLALVDPTPYASVHGLVLIAPAISFGTWALVVPDAPTRRWGWLAVTSLLGYLLFSLLAGWPGQGGLQWGPRYALPLYPVWIIAGTLGLFGQLRAADEAARLSGRVMLGLALLMVGIGAGFQIRGVTKMAETRMDLGGGAAQLLALPPDTLLITDVNYLALSMPAVYTTHTLLFDSAVFAEGGISGWSQRAGALGYGEVCAVTTGNTKTGLRLRCLPAEGGP